MDTTFIPSKGRGSNCNTHRNLEAFDIHNWVYIVEPDDYWSYVRRLRDDGVYEPESHVYAFDLERFKSPRDANHPDGFDYCDDLGWQPGLTTGPGPARNALHQLAIDMGLKHYWMMDDDIQSFTVDAFFFQKNIWTKDIANGGVREKRLSLNDIFCLYQRFLDKFDNIGLAEIDKQGLVQNHRKNSQFSVNCKTYTCIRFRTDGPKIPWRSRFNDDVTISLDYEKRGFVNVSSKILAYQTPDTQSQKGGMTEAFHQEGTLRKVKYLVKSYPETTFAILKFGRIHHLVDYSKFRQRLARKPGYERIDDLMPESMNPYGTFIPYLEGVTTHKDKEAHWQNIDDALMREYIMEQRKTIPGFAEGSKAVVPRSLLPDPNAKPIVDDEVEELDELDSAPEPDDEVHENVDVDEY
jgi:hypothetical protein